MDWIVLWAKPFEINEAVLLPCFEDLMGMNILPGTGRQHFGGKTKDKIPQLGSSLKPKDKDITLAVCINPNGKVLSKM